MVFDSWLVMVALALSVPGVITLAISGSLGWWLVCERHRPLVPKSGLMSITLEEERDEWWRRLGIGAVFLLVTVLSLGSAAGVWFQKERWPLGSWPAQAFLTEDERVAIRDEREARRRRAEAFSTRLVACFEEHAHEWPEAERRLALEESGFSLTQRLPDGCYWLGR